MRSHGGVSVRRRDELMNDEVRCAADGLRQEPQLESVRKPGGGR
jgi:hypothetical protein